MHEWSASLNEQELTPVLPSNRETGRLSDTWIKMDALYFLQCSVREQGETGEGAEREVGGRKDTCMQGGIMGNIRIGWWRGGTGGSQSAYATRTSQSGKIKTSILTLKSDILCAESRWCSNKYIF